MWKAVASYIIPGFLISFFRWLTNKNNNGKALTQAETSIELQELPGEQTNEVETLRIDCKNLQTRNDELERLLHEKEKDWETLKMDFNDLRTRNDELERLLHEKEKDFNDLRTRLSEIGALQLADGNPNITDLSDQNRPDKIAEQFSELYDNQWTDCYVVLMDRLMKSEQESVETLLTIVKTVYDISLNRSQEITSDARKALVAFAGMSDEESEKGLDCLIQETLHKMKSYRTKHFKDVPLDIAKEINEKLVETIGEEGVTACSEYIEDCVRICWLMCIKDPPMHIFCEKEDVFDKNHFMEYTEKGHRVSYVVWPVLYLHKNGPIMRKGVAQGEGKQIEDSKAAENDSQFSTGTNQIFHCNVDNHVETECFVNNEHSLESMQTRESQNTSEDVSVQEPGSDQQVVTEDIISTVAESNSSNKGEDMHLTEADDSGDDTIKCQDGVSSQTENDTLAESSLQGVIEGFGIKNIIEGNEAHVTDEEQLEQSEDTANDIKSFKTHMNLREETSYQSEETRNQSELYHTHGDVVSKDREDDTIFGDKETDDKIAAKDQAEEQVKSRKTDVTNAMPLYNIEDQGSRTSSTEAETERQVEEDRKDDMSGEDKDDEDKTAGKHQVEVQ